MNIRSLLLLLLLLGIAVFTALNWQAFIAPTSLSFLVATVEAPLGLMLLGAIILLAAVALAAILHLRTVMLLESRTHARELQAMRKLAEEAEASRLAELQRMLEAGLQRQDTQATEAKTEVINRIDLVERNLRGAVEQGGNILAAYIGELEDRLERENGVLTPHRIR